MLARNVAYHDLGPLRVVTASFFAPTAIWPVLGSTSALTAAAIKLQGVAAGVAATPDPELEFRAVAELFERVSCLAYLKRTGKRDESITGPFGSRGSQEESVTPSAISLDGRVTSISSANLYQFSADGRVSTSVGARSTNGVAVHTTLDKAVSGALLEMLERDTVLRWWDRSPTVRALGILESELDDSTVELKRALEKRGVAISLIKIRRLRELWVCVSVLRYPNLRRRNVVGSAAGFSASQAARKALIEAAVLMESLRTPATPGPAQVQATLLSSLQFDAEFDARLRGVATSEGDAGAFGYLDGDVRRVFVEAKVRGAIVQLNEASMADVGLIAVRAIVPEFRVPHYDLQWPGNENQARLLYEAGRLMPIG